MAQPAAAILTDQRDSITVDTSGGNSNLRFAPEVIWPISDDRDFSLFTGKIRLRKTIRKCAQRLWSDNPRDDNYVSPKAVFNAISLVQNLPRGAATPSVNSDDEGGVLFVWDHGDLSMLLSVGETTLDFVYRPGSVDAVHIPNLQYTGAKIPDEIATLILR